MVVQLAEQDPLSALNAFFVHLQPVVEAEGAHKGALGVQCVRVLEHLLDKLAGGKAVLGEEEAAHCAPCFSSDAERAVYNYRCFRQCGVFHSVKITHRRYRVFVLKR